VVSNAVPEAKEPVEGESIAATVRGTRAGLIVLAGVGTLNLGNAAFHLVVARALGPSQYSEVASLVAVSGLIALPFGGVQIAVAKFVADDATKGDAEAVAAFIFRATRAALIVGLALTAVVTAISPLLRNALGVTSLSAVVLTALYTLPAILAPALLGISQGFQRFTLLSASMIAGTLVRIGLVVALIPFGLGVGGVMGATLLSGFAAVALPVPLAWRWLRKPRAALVPGANASAIKYLIPVMAGMLAITSLTTVDLIVAKVALSPKEAGIYGAASFIGRLLLYLPAAVVTVLLPKVASRAAAERDTDSILHASLAVTGVFSLAGTGLLVAFPHIVIQATFGAKYDGAIPLIGLFGLAMTGYALLNVLLVYHLGHGRKGMAWFLLGGACVQLVLYGVVHGSTYQLVGANLASSVVLLLTHELVFGRTLPGAVGWLLHRGRSLN
jgi:O-antigen/teichoic acid export membrane protein